MFGSPNCSTVSEEAASDAGIAGAGVLLSFIITAGLALILSASLILQEFRRDAASRPPSLIRRKLLSAYSDQQILTGIGIQSVGLAKADSLVPYHFFLIWMLSLLSMAVHNATLLALVHDFRRDWVLRWLRQLLMFVNLVLSCVYGVFVLESTEKGLPGTLPIACVWQSWWTPSGQPTGTVSLAYVGTIVTIAGNCIVFALASWYLHYRSQGGYRIIQTIGVLLMAGITIGAAVRIFLLSQAFGNPDVQLSDGGEKEWSFGQLLALLVLLFPVISAIEIWRGEIKVAPPVDEDEAPLFDGEMQKNPSMRTSYQLNPS